MTLKKEKHYKKKIVFLKIYFGRGARGFTGRAGAPESLASTGAIESLGSRAIKKNMQPH